jgi:large subunit ribosomal protein L6
MSKVGKKPVEIPQDVKIEDKGNVFVVTGPKGELSRKYPDRLLSIKIGPDSALIVPISKTEKAFVNWGTYRSHLANMVKGVKEGWKKTLELVGVGYRAEVQDRDLVLTVGFSHPVKILCPEGITFKVEKSIITVEGIDKERVGETADKVRSVRPPEPYKGKGIKYTDEIVRRKAGKAAKTQAA